MPPQLYPFSTQYCPWGEILENVVRKTVPVSTGLVPLGMLATQMNEKVLSKEIDQYCVVVLNRYVCNTIHGRK